MSSSSNLVVPYIVHQNSNCFLIALRTVSSVFLHDGNAYKALFVGHAAFSEIMMIPFKHVFSYVIYLFQNPKKCFNFCPHVKPFAYFDAPTFYFNEYLKYIFTRKNCFQRWNSTLPWWIVFSQFYVLVKNKNAKVNNCSLQRKTKLQNLKF